LQFNYKLFYIEFTPSGCTSNRPSPEKRRRRFGRPLREELTCRSRWQNISNRGEEMRENGERRENIYNRLSIVVPSSSSFSIPPLSLPQGVYLHSLGDIFSSGGSVSSKPFWLERRDIYF